MVEPNVAATSGVLSVDPSSTTITSTSPSPERCCASALSMARPRNLALFQVGMMALMTIVTVSPGDCQQGVGTFARLGHEIVVLLGRVERSAADHQREIISN